MTQTAAQVLPWSDTHPFLTFTFRLDQLLPESWTLLGECSSKIEHISRVAMRPDTAQALFQIFLVKGVHGTTAIEGNTLSEAQVARRVEGKLPLPASQEYLGTEVDNIVKAYLWLIDQIRKGAPISIAPADLKYLNLMVLEGTEVRDEVVPGEFRKHVVEVNDYRSPSAAYNDELVGRLCTWMNEPRWTEVLGSQYVLPIIKAIAAHLYIAWIHPFGDGNGRTARLVEFDILSRAGVPPISAHLLSDHYNKTRGAYYRALSAARRNPCEFLRYALQGFADGLREQVERIWVQQMQVTWTNHVHGVFARLPQTRANHRRRDVAIALGHTEGPTPISDLPALRPQLAAAYVNSQRMLQRDLNMLMARRLVVPTSAGHVKANVDLLTTFLPIRNTARDTE